MSGKYEYKSPKKLDGVSKYFIKIPESVIFDDKAGSKLITAFSFFSIAKGLDGNAMFTLNGIVEWSGKKPDRRSDGINCKFKKSIERLEGLGYISINGEPSNARCCVASIDMDKINKECDEFDFSIVYVDEIQKILAWKNQNQKDSFVNCDVMLRVFAYLRMLIRRRANKLPPDDEDIEIRRARWPEAWNGYYGDMAKELGISPRAMSSAVDALCDIGLLYAESLPRTKVGGKWKTSHTIFCNAYKREGQFVLAGGNEYYMREIENKKKLLKMAGKSI